MDQLDIEKFDPTTAELTAMVEATKSIAVTDLKDKAQLEIVRTNRITLKKARVSIEKKGKELRESAVAFQKAVIAKEKELIGIIEPEEDRLAAIEEEAKQMAIREERERKLPARRESLGSIPNTLTDEAIIAMDDVTFAGVLDRLKADQVANEQARKEAELNARQAEIEAKERESREKEAVEKRERDRQAEIERARLEGERKAKEEMEWQEAEKKAEEERKAAQAKAEMEKLEKRKKYVAFLVSHGWTEETKGDFKTEETATGYVLYKKLGVFNK